MQPVTSWRVRGAWPTRVIALVGLSALICYAGALVRFPLRPTYAQPIMDLAKLTESSGLMGAALVCAVISLFVGYGAGISALANARGPRGDGRMPRTLLALVLGLPLVFVLMLLLVYPFSSLDIYDYIVRGRMLARYNANTFIQTPTDFKSDPLYWYSAWRRAVTAYGPLWESMSTLTARLAGERPVPPGMGRALEAELLRLMLGYKLLAALGYLFCGGAIWLTLWRTAPAQRWLGLYIWLWNPMALWESVGAGHNDAWMAGLIVLAVGLLLPLHGSSSAAPMANDEGRMTKLPGATPSSFVLRPWSLKIGTQAGNPVLATATLAFLVLTLGGLVKYLALIFGPLLLAAALRRLPGWRSRAQLVVLGGAACALLVVWAYAPFWVGEETLRNFRDRTTLFTTSWLAVLQAPIKLPAVQALVGAPNLLALVVPEQLVQTTAVRMGLVLLAGGLLWACWRVWRAPEQLARAALGLLLWFLFFCNPWFQPWYLLWALALLAIQPWRAVLTRAVVVFCCTAMLSYMAFVFLLPALGWAGFSFEANILTSALIYLPPLQVLIWGAPARRPGLLRRLWAPARARRIDPTP